MIKLSDPEDAPPGHHPKAAEWTVFLPVKELKPHIQVTNGCKPKVDQFEGL